MPLEHNRNKEKSSLGIIRRFQKANEHYKQAAIIDPVTNIYNRTYFNVETDRASRSRHPCHIFIIDIDHFKAQNDAHGHPSGDEILKDSGKILTISFREEDTVCRIGGDEFGVLMINETDKNNDEMASKKITEIKANLSKINEEREQKGLPVFDFTIGHAVHLPYLETTINDAIRRADDNLYLNKKTKGIN